MSWNGKKTRSTKIEITTIDKTYNDPLARKLRYFLKKNRLSVKTKVCFSKELPVKLDSKVIASSVFVPATAGMVIASEVLKDTIKRTRKMFNLFFFKIFYIDQQLSQE